MLKVMLCVMLITVEMARLLCCRTIGNLHASVLRLLVIIMLELCSHDSTFLG